MNYQLFSVILKIPISSDKEISFINNFLHVDFGEHDLNQFLSQIEKAMASLKSAPKNAALFIFLETLHLNKPEGPGWQLLSDYCENKLKSDFFKERLAGIENLALTILMEKSPERLLYQLAGLKKVAEKTPYLFPVLLKVIDLAKKEGIINPWQAEKLRGELETSIEQNKIDPIGVRYWVSEVSKNTPQVFSSNPFRQSCSILLR